MSDTAYFVALALDPPEQFGPAGAEKILWSHKGMGTALFGYIKASDRVIDAQTAAEAFLEHSLEQGLIPAGHTVLPRVSVGTISDADTVTLP